MDTQAETLARAIGARVKQERKHRDWTLDQLAAAAGVSRRMLVNVEQGAANPSIGTMLRLAEALGVGLPALVEPPAEQEVRITRSGDGAALWTGEHGGRGVLVSAHSAPDVIELWDWTLAPGEQHASTAHIAGARELLHVLEGALTVECGEQRHELEAGDALAFRGDVDHRYANPHDAPARFSLTVFEPGPATPLHSHTADPDDAGAAR